MSQRRGEAWGRGCTLQQEHTAQSAAAGERNRIVRSTMAHGATEGARLLQVPLPESRTLWRGRLLMTRSNRRAKVHP